MFLYGKQLIHSRALEDVPSPVVACKPSTSTIHPLLDLHDKAPLKMDSRFTINPFGNLTLTTEDRTKIVDITNAIILEKFEEYEEHLNNGKKVDLSRWKKIAKSGPTIAYIERRSSSVNSNLPQLQMAGPLPGSLDENMFGMVNPTNESMRIKASYLKDFSAAAVLATIIEPTVDDPFRSVVVKWMEIDIPFAYTLLGEFAAKSSMLPERRV